MTSNVLPETLSSEQLSTYCRYLETQLAECDAQLKVAYKLIDKRRLISSENAKALQAANMWLTTLLMNLQAGVLVEDAEQRITLVNQRYCALFGIETPVPSLIGSSAAQLTEQGKHAFVNADQFTARIEQIIQERQPVNAEELLLVDGRVLERDYIPVFLDARYRGHLWKYRDVTGHKQAEEDVRQSEERLRRLTDNMLDLIFQTDADGIIEYASPSCWSVLGYSPEALLGQSIYFWLHPDDVAFVKESIGIVDRVEYRCLHRDGRYLWIETISNLLFGDNGTVNGIVFASRDVTERKQAEQQLRKLNQLKSEFLSTAAHELRTPLTSIRGFSEILLTRELDTTRLRRYVTLINDQSNQLGKIIDDLLDVSRLEAGRGLQITLEPVELGALLQEVLAPFEESVHQHQIQLEGTEGLPLIPGDPFRLAQVCKNLISNAIKYSPNGGIVTIRCHSLPACVEIAVQDQGIGMTAEQQSHLFQKFYRANASNTAISGTGLGLAISKLIVELHGGTITVESEYGVGTTFYFTLPLLNAQG